MRFARLIVTAIDDHWLEAGLNQFCGYGTSVIECDAEVGVETKVSGEQSPDGRPGASVLAFAFNESSLQKALAKRVGQCLLTCPTTAVFSGLDSEKSIDLGNRLRYFGDGYQKSKLIDGRRYWRIPVMDGEFLIEETTGVSKGIAGGNLLIESTGVKNGLAAAKRVVDAIDELDGVMAPFPGGVVRSGSKVGSRYKGLIASTAHKYCPTLKGRVDSELAAETNCVYEVVIDGVDFQSMQTAMRKGVEAAVGEGIVKIGAGNYGGKLGKHHFYLHRLWEN